MAAVAAIIVVGTLLADPSGPVRSRDSPRPVGPGQRLVFSADFTGPAGSPPNPRQWIHDVGDWGHSNRELETYTASPGNASLDGHGDLAIVARRPASSGPAHPGLPYTSARIETMGRFSFTYGRVEARIKIPAGTGLWPGFWMLGSNINSVGWPACGEVDILEAVGQRPFTVVGSIHGPGSGGPYAVHYPVRSRVSLAAGFHTYGMIWRPGSITWTLDYRPYGTVTRRELPAGARWVFDHPFNLVLNLAVGGIEPGPPTAATRFPATLLVNWIRVYQ